jgi:hypothetical protein
MNAARTPFPPLGAVVLPSFRDIALHWIDRDWDNPGSGLVSEYPREHASNNFMHATALPHVGGFRHPSRTVKIIYFLNDK